jgi:hypothetical protein
LVSVTTMRYRICWGHYPSLWAKPASRGSAASPDVRKSPGCAGRARGWRVAGAGDQPSVRQPRRGRGDRRDVSDPVAGPCPTGCSGRLLRRRPAGAGRVSVTRRAQRSRRWAGSCARRGRRGRRTQVGASRSRHRPSTVPRRDARSPAWRSLHPQRQAGSTTCRRQLRGRRIVVWCVL